ncbi:hypothetical protein ACWDUI_09520 [Streptosporangium sandarakinum]|uniref:hypothetical protein n=1 Tax=Streptosporangium sandarakinum TaxID=1260955 RepID=UPI003687A4C6
MAYQKFQACFRDVKRARHPELKDIYRVTQEDEPLQRCLIREHGDRLVLSVFPGDGRTCAFVAATGPRLIERYHTTRDIAGPRGVPHAEYV